MATKPYIDKWDYFLVETLKVSQFIIKINITNTRVDKIISQSTNLIILKLTNTNWEESEALFFF